jgi:disulfide bond formation protein DsbB
VTPRGKTALLLGIGTVGVLGTALSVLSEADRSKRFGEALAAFGAATAGALVVTLLRHRVHPANAPVRPPSKVLSVVGSLLGVTIAMTARQSSFDPMILGAITGTLMAVFAWSMALTGRDNATG